MTDYPPEQLDPHSDASDKPNSNQSLRKRDKFLKVFGLSKSEHKVKAKTSTQSLHAQPSHRAIEPSSIAFQSNNIPLGDDQSVALTVAKDKPLPLSPAEDPLPVPTAMEQTLINIFPENIPKPTVKTDLPRPQERIEKTDQLVYSIRLLLKMQDLHASGKLALDLDETERSWMKALEQDPIEQYHLRWLVTKVVEEFVKDDIKGAAVVSEAVILAPVLDRNSYRSLLCCIIDKFETTTLFDIGLLQGLVQLIESGSPGYLEDDDLVRTLAVLRRRLKDTHQPSAEYVYQTVRAIPRLLDVMVNSMVKGLNRTQEHQPLAAILQELKDTTDPILQFQVNYALQALQYVPDDEATLQAVLRFAGGISMAALGVASMCKLDPANLFESLDTLRQAAGQSYEVTKSILEGLEASQQGRYGAMQSLLKGLRAGTKHEWFLTLLAARSFVQHGLLADFKRTVYKAHCRDELYFQLGICQILGEIAVDPLWDSFTRQQSLYFLGVLLNDKTGWKQHLEVRQWILVILTQLSALSDFVVKDRAASVLQDWNQQGASVSSSPYCLKIGLALPESSPLLTRVQQIPHVERDLHVMKVQRLQEAYQPVYIPPMAKANLQARNEDLFSLMEKVEEFLASDRQVMLILGDSGAGKSTFNKHLETKLLRIYNSGGRIPLFVNLPAIRRPEEDTIGNQLRTYNFSEAQIQELKQHRQFILICDGYDESQLAVNLHTTNGFNRPGQWSVKMVISCRTQYLGQDYRDRFVPQEVGHYSRPALNLFQEAVIAPFYKEQIQDYVKQYVPLESRSWVTQDYMDRLITIPDLMDMAKNPFLLSLALEALPGVTEGKQDLSTIKIARVQLYDTFVQHWLDVNKRRLQGSNLNNEDRAMLDLLLQTGFVSMGIDYSTRLVSAIFEKHNGNPVVQYDHFKAEKTWKAEFFGPESRL
ncbi:hypothetical protein BGW39_001260 [Mortierella sp. 14UC]|nr:hypothetical protein BGW39_001260 [Mortierella sp. 14UC]